MLAGKRHGLTRLRVTPLPRRTEMQREAAEPADLDALTLCEFLAHDLQDLLQRQLHVARGQVLLLGRDDFDEFRLGHAGPSWKAPAPRVSRDTRGFAAFALVAIAADLLLQQVAQAGTGGAAALVGAVA